MKSKSITEPRMLKQTYFIHNIQQLWLHQYQTSSTQRAETPANA